MTRSLKANSGEFKYSGQYGTMMEGFVGSHHLVHGCRVPDSEFIVSNSGL